MAKKLTKKKFSLILGSVLVLIAAGAAAYFIWLKPKAPVIAETSGVNTTRVRSGDLVISAAGSGTIITESDIQIGFDSTGILEAIYVSVGEKVEAGDELAKLKSDPQLTLNVATAKIAEINARQALEAVDADWKTNLANAQLNYLTAKDELADLTVDRATLNYNRCTDEINETKEADYYQAKDNYERQYDIYDQLYRGRDAEDLGKQEMEATVATAKIQMDTAWANWQYCLGKPSEDEIDIADANISIKQAEVDAYLAEWESMKDGPDADELELKNAELEQAQAELEIAEANLNGLVLTAPVSGTVMEINGIIGTEVGSAFMRLADLSTPILEFYMDESDIANVAVGDDVEVTFDAFEDQIFEGNVIQISPELVSSGNVGYVYGLIELSPSSYAKQIDLPIGMSATIEVIGGRAENALLVPVEALKEVDDDQYAVFKMENGVPRLYEVQVGLMDFTYAQILSGLSLGDEVTTGIVETIQ
jgi:multidrug efflux pump subunit AcrA (membrane-fusion protein)